MSRELSESFFDRLTADIPADELALFDRLLAQMVEKARELKKGQEEGQA